VTAQRKTYSRWRMQGGQLLHMHEGIQRQHSALQQDIEALRRQQREAAARAGRWEGCVREELEDAAARCTPVAWAVRMACEIYLGKLDSAASQYQKAEDQFFTCRAGQHLCDRDVVQCDMLVQYPVMCVTFMKLCKCTDANAAWLPRCRAERPPSTA
jgi:hypothetical protein